jgi:acyl carrier protein
MMTVDSDSNLLAELRCVFRTSLGVDPLVPIEPETRFFADLGLASIDAVVLGEALQQHFSRPIPFQDLMAELGRRDQRDMTIGDLVDFLRVHLGQPADPAVPS